ncbi:hypothetical protein D049_0606A, partial [Vibrio parahaemolyticus VPTS-2010]
MPKWLMLC